MSNEKQHWNNVIERLPDELTSQALKLIEQLQKSYKNCGAPESVVVKNKDDLIKKLEKGIDDTEHGRVCSLEEAYKEVKEILAN